MTIDFQTMWIYNVNIDSEPCTYFANVALNQYSHPQERILHMLKKMKRALALGAVAAIALLFMVTLILAFIDTEKARELLMASIVATIVIPTLIYVYLWLFQLFTKKKEDEK